MEHSVQPLREARSFQVALLPWSSLEGNMKHVGKLGRGEVGNNTAQESSRPKGLVRKHKHTLANFHLRIPGRLHASTQGAELTAESH